MSALESQRNKRKPTTTSGDGVVVGSADPFPVLEDSLNKKGEVVSEKTVKKVLKLVKRAGERRCRRLSC